MLRCGLLGEKLGHSYSPAIHALLANYEYELYERAPGELEDFLKNGGFDGLNVTIPYKKAVIPYCAELSDIARRLGSVNTIVRRGDGSLYGDNTDAFGFAGLVRHSGVDVAGEKHRGARQRRRIRHGLRHARRTWREEGHGAVETRRI